MKNHAAAVAVYGKILFAYERKLYRFEIVIIV